VVNPHNPQLPPKLSETPPPVRNDRAAAWACVVSNLVLPGLGTFVARHRIAGVLQLVISQTGFLLMLLWAISYALRWIHQGSLPEDLGPSFRFGALGMAFFLLAWFWSVASSIEIVWRSRGPR
jgi:hypothetical protein